MIHGLFLLMPGMNGQKVLTWNQTESSGTPLLNATSQALKKNFQSYNKINEYKKDSQILKNFVKKHDTVVIVHIFYPELWNELRFYLTNLNQEFDLLISIPENLEFLVDQIFEFYPQAVVYRCLNRGRDINPFVQFLREIEKFQYKYICKIHTKKSNHRDDGDLWRKSMLDQLLGSNKRIEKIKSNLDLRDVGIIGPKDHLLSTESFIGGNQQLINELSEKLNIIYWGEPFRFIAGSMFWCKPEAINQILDLCLVVEDFPEEEGQIDCTLAHAIERLFGLIAYKRGYKVIQTETFSEIFNTEYRFAEAKQ